jgi:hypothetical protein
MAFRAACASCQILLAINPKERRPFLQRHFAGGSEPVSKVYDGVEWTDKDVRI